MPNGLREHGAQTEPSRRGTIHVAKAISGVVTNRFALSDPSSIVTQRFYGGRQDVILAGSNIEILPSSEWGRRFGTSPYTTFLFPTPPLGGFAFNSNGVFTVYVDTATTIYVVTPTSGTAVFTKGVGAGQANYLQLGSTLFITTGVDNIKIINGIVYNWGIVAPVAAPGVSIVQTSAAEIFWNSSTAYSTMGLILDTNSNVEQLIQIPTPVGTTYPNTQLGASGGGAPLWNNTLGGTTTEGSGTPIVWRNLGSIQPWAANTSHGDSSNSGALTNPAVIYDATSQSVYVQVGSGKSVTISAASQYTAQSVGYAGGHPLGDAVVEGNTISPANGFPNAAGYHVTVAGMNQSLYDGTFSSVSSQTPGFVINSGFYATAVANNGGPFTYSLSYVLNTSGFGESSGGKVQSCLALYTTSTAHGLTAGETVVISGVANAAYNGTLVVVSVPSATQFTADIGVVGTAASSGGTASTTALLSGSVKPLFNGVAGSSFVDNQCNWDFLGTFSQLNAWKKSTNYTDWYLTGFDKVANAIIEPFILPPPNNQSVYLQIPTNTGTSGTGTASPVWSTVTGGQTKDGGLLWLNLGSSVWTPNSVYTAWTREGAIFSVVRDVNDNFQVCIGGGISSGVVPAFGTVYGATVQDGSVTWVCVGGSELSWVAGQQWFLPPVEGFTPPLPNAAYGSATIVDSNSNAQYVVQSGVSGTPSAPSWNGIGATTTEGSAAGSPPVQLTWYNNGVYAQPLIAWSFGYGYGYAFKSRTTTDFYVTNTPYGMTLPNGVPTGCQDGSVSSSSPIFKMANNIRAIITNVAETSGNVVTITAHNTFVAGSSVGLVGLTSATWLNGQIVSVSPTGLSSTSFQFSDPTSHGTFGSIAETGAATGTNSNLGAVNVVTGVGSTDPQVDTVVLFRCTDGFQSGGPYLEATEFPAPPPLGGVAQPWQFLDTILDTQLNNLVQADIIGQNAPPPAGLGTLAYSQGRIWSHGSGSVTTGVSAAQSNTVYASSGADIPPDNGNGLTGWGAANNFPLTSPVTKLTAPMTGLLALTTTDVWSILGGPAISQYFPTVTRPGLGLASRNAVISLGNQVMIFSADRRLLVLTNGIETDPFGPGIPISDQLMLLDPSKVYLTLHENGTDQAVYLGDGSTGWWRLVLTQWPNGEICWSPFATITGGVGMLLSLQTASTARTLLIGSLNNNTVLLKRDLSTWEDNGTPYACNYTVGGIPLCEDGQLAELLFITTTGPRVGSAPTVSYLLNEISGTYNQFATYVNDPPSLYGIQLAPSSVYRNRYYFMQTMSDGGQPPPIWCTDILINFAFPAENAQNVIARFSVYGQLWNDDQI